ncbi:DUF3530 domain-containing protein [Gammaproteobacteria bacterium]
MRLALLVFGGCLTTPLPGADLSREQHVREQIEDLHVIGEPLTLSAQGVDFLGLFIPATVPKPRRRGGLVMLHGLATHPDEGQVIHPLRIHLAEHGWETLAIQLPLADSEAPVSDYLALIPEALPRIDMAVAFLKQRDISHILLVGHDLGARMGLAYLAANPPEEVRGLVALGLATDRQEATNPTDGVLAPLRKIQQPILDLYGTRDLPEVLASARDRKIAAQEAHNVGYHQATLPQADHFFRNLTNVLLGRVRGWLSTIPPLSKPSAGPRKR